MNAAGPCVLCGEPRDTRVELIRWKTPVEREKYTAAPRCRDRAKCRERVEASGSWEVDGD